MKINNDPLKHLWINFDIHQTNNFLPKFFNGSWFVFVGVSPSEKSSAVQDHTTWDPSSNFSRNTVIFTRGDKSGNHHCCNHVPESISCKAGHAIKKNARFVSGVLDETIPVPPSSSFSARKHGATSAIAVRPEKPFEGTTGLCGVGGGQISECLVTARTVAGSVDIRHHVSVSTAVYCSSSCPRPDLRRRINCRVQIRA
ncbi:hypothetical protein QTP88_008889 [Uroleucon formosanum]